MCVLPDGYSSYKKALKRLLEPAFLIALAVFFALNVFLFYNQAFAGYTGRYFSDTATHYDWACYDGGFLSIPSQARAYPLFHLTLRAFSLFFSTEMSGALAESCYNALSAALIYVIICAALSDRRVRARIFDRERDFTRVVPVLLTFALMTCSMLVVPTSSLFGSQWHAYLGAFTPNPWHNPTYIAARPFAIVSVFLFAKLITLRDADFKPWALAAFSLSTALGTFAKPSLAPVLLPVAGVMTAARLFTKERRRALLLGLSFLPTFALLAWQYSLVYSAGAQSVKDWGGGLSLDPGGVWASFTPCVPLAILLGGAFGIFVACCEIRRFKGLPAYYRVSVYLYLVSLLEALLLRSGGREVASGDFMWGYMYGLFFLFAASALLLLERPRELGGGKRRAAWSLFALHALCGLGYFAWVLAGNNYA